MTGTFLNIATVVIGSLIGSALGNRLPDRMRETVMDGLGLMTLAVGLNMAIGTHNILIPLFSVLLGGVLGEWWHIETHLEAAGRWLERRFGDTLGNTDERSVTRAFVTASLVFCVGPLSVLGPIQDGLTGDYSLLAIKSLLDGFASLAFAASLGPGVILSVVTIFLYQGGLSLGAGVLATALGSVTRETPWVIEMTATGGVLILGISLILLDLKRIRVANLLPAIVIAPAIVIILERLNVPY
ncbi:MAG TPA: DUF554 domain-containing protein [Anaerolineae bacterium]|nr:DUF554 domain-containing protein [Anaerolineae bacterium]HIQ05314.1 DUF554 domain-containing protein [Anaerolineae bacterium]